MGMTPPQPSTGPLCRVLGTGNSRAKISLPEAGWWFHAFSCILHVTCFINPTVTSGCWKMVSTWFNIDGFDDFELQLSMLKDG